jgi:LTXXQ motif family protein
LRASLNFVDFKAGIGMRRSIEKSEVGRGLKSARSVQMTAVRHERIVSYTLAAASLSVSSVALTTANAAGNQLAEAIPTARIQHWVANDEALVGARLGCLKAVLQLAPEQNELWEDFEKAVRHAAKRRRMDDVRQMLGNHDRIPSAERMDSTAGRMARRGGELKEISEASKPLYGRLDDPQSYAGNWVTV